MTSTPADIGTATARPSAAVSTPGLLRAGGRILRLFLLLLVLLCLAKASGPWQPIATPVAIMAGALLAWLVRKEHAEAQAGMVYIGGFALFAEARVLSFLVRMKTHYHYVIGIERAIFGGAVPTVWLQQHLYHAGQVSALDWATTTVYVSYFVMIHVVALLIWRLKPQRLWPFVIAVLGTLYVGVLTYAFDPSGPPWLAAQLGYLPQIVKIVPAVLGQVDPAIYHNGELFIGRNQVAAMPSLHMATTVLVALGLSTLHRRLRWVGLAYVLAMGFSLVYLGEHYVTDEIAGAVLAIAMWYGAQWWWDRKTSKKVGAKA